MSSGRLAPKKRYRLSLMVRLKHVELVVTPLLVAEQTHHQIGIHYQSTSKSCIQVPQDLIVGQLHHDHYAALELLCWRWHRFLQKGSVMPLYGQQAAASMHTSNGREYPSTRKARLEIYRKHCTFYSLHTHAISRCIVPYSAATCQYSHQSDSMMLDVAA